MNTKEEKAQEYAEKKLRTTYPNMTLSRIDKAVDLFDTYDIQQAFEDGYTACEQSMWRSVEEELPEENELVLVKIELPQAVHFDLARFSQDDNDFALIIGSRERYIVTHWMRIPDTDTEKK